MPRYREPLQSIRRAICLFVCVSLCSALLNGMGLPGAVGLGYADEESAPEQTSVEVDEAAGEGADAPSQDSTPAEQPANDAVEDEGEASKDATPEDEDANEETPEPDGVPGDIINVLGPDDLEPPALFEAIGAVVMDQSGTVLFEKNPEMELPLASTTKVMTAMVALDEGPALDEVVTLQEVPLPWDAQAVYYGNGDTLTFGELLRVMLVYSANDAAYNVAILTSGSQEAFAERMNAKAQELGMEHSHFINPHGLHEEGHYSCARDLAVMTRYAMQNYPVIAQDVQQQAVTTTVRGVEETFATTDRLLGNFNGMRGVKTGAVANNLTFVGASGRGSVQLYTAVLGCITNDGRFGDTASMMEWAYSHYAQRQLIRADWPIRLQASSFDLGRKSVISARSDFVGNVWAGEGELTYQGLLCKATRVIEPGSGCGWISWKQGERSMGGALFSARPVPERVSAWPLFATPLFYNTQALGNLVQE